MAKRIPNDTIHLSGVDISEFVRSWSLNSDCRDLRTVTVEMYVDDFFTVNGKTIADMLGTDEGTHV